MSRVLDAVGWLNCDFYTLTEIADFYPFTFRSDGYVDQIFFMEQLVYNSDDDSGIMTDDETGEPLQTIEEYCIQEAKKVLESLLPILKWEK